MIRNYKIDILRSIGTLLVILAHMQIPKWLIELRSFDVVLLTIISGISFTYSYNGNYMRYFFKRVKKLLLPTYIMMCILFLSTRIICTYIGRKQLYSLTVIKDSFIFSDQGIGYIWIIKVYMFLAIVLPLLYVLNLKIKSDKYYLFSTILLMGVYFLGLPKIYSQGFFLFNEYIVYVAPYGMLGMLGIRLQGSSKDFKIKILLISGILFFCFTILLDEFKPSYFKYPPNYYYILYGIFISIFLLMIIPNKNYKITEYISKNSFILYLSHIFSMLFYNFFLLRIQNKLINNFVFQYCFVLFLSLIFTEIEKKIRKLVITKLFIKKLKIRK